ncbi:ATP-binding cassette domain-containing protein, partial [Clostridioides difficile]|uniref:ATP-binding cassette domain-containing protein n=1 Tax=Clostridioides difficile TaxID=1496 RepID=UPI001EED3079
SLTVNEGDFISIMGPSGAGKTTLLNLMSTLDKQTSGEIILDGISYRLNNYYDNNAVEDKKRVWNKVDSYYVEDGNTISIGD